MNEGIGAFYANTTRRNDGGSGSYPRYSMVFTERAASPTGIPTDEDIAWGFFSSTSPSNTDAKFIIGVLNGVLPSNEWATDLSDFSGGIAVKTDRVSVTPGIILNPQTSEPTAVEGHLYYDSTSHVLKYWDNTTWQTITTLTNTKIWDIETTYNYTVDLTARSTSSTSWTTENNMTLSITPGAMNKIFFVIMQMHFWSSNSSNTVYARLNHYSGCVALWTPQIWTRDNSTYYAATKVLFGLFRTSSTETAQVRMQWYTESSDYTANCDDRYAIAIPLGY